MHSLQQNGFFIEHRVADAAAINALIESVVVAERSTTVRSRGTQVYAVRNLLSENARVAAFARSRAVRSVIEDILGKKAFAVRAIWFDKTPDANWKVAWHQDLSIAVQQKIQTPGFGPWSIKAGIVHVQPPVDVLVEMVTLRLHLDDCTPANGPLKTIAGSHAHGVLSPGQIEQWRTTMPITECLAPRGGAVLMRPLILHASSPAKVPAHRRVLHLEYASRELPNGLDWSDRC